MYDIEIYEDITGNSDIISYFNILKTSNSKENRLNINKIRLYINLLQKHGFSLGKPYIKKNDKEIWELRPLRNRILFASLYDNKIILLSVFMKQTKKTPKYEIKKLINY